MMWAVLNPGQTPLDNHCAEEITRPPVSSTPPTGCSQEVFIRYTALMLKCWQHKPAARPGFEEVHQELTQLYSNTKAEHKAAHVTQVSQPQAWVGLLTAAQTNRHTTQQSDAQPGWRQWALRYSSTGFTFLLLSRCACRADAGNHLRPAHQPALPESTSLGLLV